MNKIIKLVKAIGRSFLMFITALQSVYKLITDKSFTRSESYFPEYSDRQKKRFEIFVDQFKWILRYAYINEFYFLYGFDIKGLRISDEYIEYRNVFRRRRDRLNNTSRFSPVVILRDKSLFGIVAKAYGINTPEIIGLINDNRIYVYEERKEYDLNSFFKGRTMDFFLKKIDGECADGVFHIVCEDGTLKIKGNPITIEYLEEEIMTMGGRYIVQKRISNQHKDLDKIYAGSINTLRMITVKDPETNRIVEFSTVLRVGREGNEVDNWAQGGLAIGVDTTKGTLREWGFYKPTFGTKVSAHPNSSVYFSNYKLPYVKEAVDMAIKFHSLLPDLHGIGWDIALTENGPCFIEGNDNYEISLNQICNHGMMKEFEKYYVYK